MRRKKVVARVRPGDCPERGARGCGHARQPMAGRREPTRDMLRIQLAHSYFLRFDQKQWERGKPYPPLATIQVAAMLRQMGHQRSEEHPSELQSLMRISYAVF